MTDVPSNDNEGSQLLLPQKYARIMGRYTTADDGSVRFDWPGVRLTFENITCSSGRVGIQMNGGHSVFGYSIIVKMDKDNTDVIQNGILNCYFHNKERLYVLAEQLDHNTRYTVSIWKRDDPGVGTVHVRGLVGAVSSSPVGDESKSRLVEFVGDSDTVGFGNMARRKSGMIYSICVEMPLMVLGLPYLRRATNVTQSYPALTAQQLDCDYHVIARSGIGAGHSIDMKETMCQVYEGALFGGYGLTDHLPKPDMVVVYIGNNDQAALDWSFRSKAQVEDTLTQSFSRLLNLIRQRNHIPKDSSDSSGQSVLIPIVVVIPHEDAKLACMMSRRENRKTIETQRAAWRRAVEAQGGEASGIYIVENRHEPDNIVFNGRKDFGMMLHWNANSHQKWANGLAPQLQAIVRMLQ